MSNDSLILEPGETLLWTGKPVYRSWPFPLLILDLAVLIVVIPYLEQMRPPSIPSEAKSGIVLTFGLLILVWIYTYSKYAGVSYYITDRRVIRKQELRIFRRTQEISLRSLVRIRAKRWFKSGTIVFQSQDTSILAFANLREDPHELQQTAEKAMSTDRQDSW